MSRTVPHDKFMSAMRRTAHQLRKLSEEERTTQFTPEAEKQWFLLCQEYHRRHVVALLKIIETEGEEAHQEIITAAHAVARGEK